MKQNVIDWLSHVLSVLSSCSSGKDYAEYWVNFRMEFYRSFHSQYIFSNRITEFEEILHRVINNTPLEYQQDNDGSRFLSDYDRNFNQWLKELA